MASGGGVEAEMCILGEVGSQAMAQRNGIEMELQILHEVFPQMSLESIKSAYNAAGGSLNAAAESLELRQSHNAAVALEKGAKIIEIDPKSLEQAESSNKNKNKWITVKSRTPKASDTGKKQRKKHKKKSEKPAPSSPDEQQQQQDTQALEDFLFSLLGSDSELGVDVILDIIEQCEGDVQKSVDALLLLISEGISNDNKAADRDISVIFDAFPQENAQYIRHLYEECGGNAEMVINKLLKTEDNHVTKGKESSYQVLFNQVLDDEYPEIELDQHDLRMLRRSFPNIHVQTLVEVLKLTQFDFSAAENYLIEAGVCPVELESANSSKRIHNKANGVKPKTDNMTGDLDAYNRLNRDATEHLTTMKSYYSAAAIAYANGQKKQATDLTEKGRQFEQLARESRGKASDLIFQIKNRNLQNNVTIDLHNQQVHEALEILKEHLKAFQLVKSIQTLTVITGYGKHSPDGLAKLKPAIIDYVRRRGLMWAEVNPGCLRIQLQAVTC